MLDWFKNLDPVVQGAIISGVVAIIVAVITGVFGLAKKGNDARHKAIIKQKQERNSKGTQIGIQNNYNNNTTIQLGDTTLDDGTIIIDGGNATGSGGIRYEPSTNSSNSGENKDE